MPGNRVGTFTRTPEFAAVFVASLRQGHGGFYTPPHLRIFELLLDLSLDMFLVYVVTPLHPHTAFVFRLVRASAECEASS